MLDLNPPHNADATPLERMLAEIKPSPLQGTEHLNMKIHTVVMDLMGALQHPSEKGKQLLQSIRSPKREGYLLLTLGRTQIALSCPSPAPVPLAGGVGLYGERAGSLPDPIVPRFVPTARKPVSDVPATSS